QQINLSTVGLDPLSHTRIDLFPNPNQGHFSLQVKSDQVRAYQFRLMDLRGRLLWEKKLRSAPASFRQTVSVPNLSPGLYLMEAIADGQRQAIKVMVE
ncbi:MAG: T9SS type A sorting domain-containing protein, partial [Bacteroidota bacterium]